MAACFCNRLVLCFDGDKTINGGVGMEVVKITKKVYKAIGCEEGHLLILKSFVRVLIYRYKRLAFAVGTNSNQKILFF